MNQRNPTMTTIVQYLPKWLRVQLQKLVQPKIKTVSKKDRQVLPIVPNKRHFTQPLAG
jgi:hypothetical protein